ncbi:MAG TPA: hypothetical protein PLI16_10495, partial [Bacteroidales bacterium]|nr:hypothetical protein [Bacteroidales bacterium]
WVFHNEMLSLFTADPKLITESLPSYYVVMATLIIFSLTMNYYNGVIGTGSTRVSMLLEVIGVVFYLIFVYFVVLVLNVSLEFAWFSEAEYFISMCILSLIYLKKGSWKRKII